MMLRLCVFLLVFCCISIKGYTQVLFDTGGASSRYVKQKKQVYDTASLHIFYRQEHLPDSTNREKVAAGDMVLQISDKYLCFGDYNQLVRDSLNDFLAENRNSPQAASAESKLGNKISKVNVARFNCKLLTDLAQQQTIVHQEVVYLYEYKHPTPTFDWQLEDRDSVINGFSCRAARCHYGGRSYTAWYTDSIPLPYGPYLFGGLPGLIVQIYDKGNTWRFTCTGIEKAHALREMYLVKDKRRRRVERKEALAIFKNEEEDFWNLFYQRAKVEINGKPAPQNNPRKPSNLIELAW